ncbi:MAG: toll/interleukin-1 receptor domain-containing protein [Bacteroidales bacterium]|nr:toll/interleukin-1 receptor domain-containing protein [Bacteroidales bacterium]
MDSPLTNLQYKYFAFISYNSHDIKWGKRLQKKLEHYRMPATLCSERGWVRTPIKPVFFAPTDIQPGGLSQELQERLAASRHLIVICSPHSAKSEWVGKEIEFFHQLGRTQDIHFFIVDGEPHSGNPDTECFNPVVEKLGLPEILGANIHEKIHHLPWLNRERAYVQLISKLLNVEFDTIWKRHRRQRRIKAMAWAVGALVLLAVLLGVWHNSQPMDVTLQVKETSVHNNNLPPLKDAVVTLALDNKTETDTLRTIDGKLVFRNIPHKYLNQPVHVTIACRDFLTTDTVITLTKDLTLNIARDPAVYGDIHFQLYDPMTEQYLPGVEVTIEGQNVQSDETGTVALQIPLSAQREKYPISASISLHEDTLYPPCTGSYMIFKK